MSAMILPFRPRGGAKLFEDRARTVASVAERFSAQWRDQNLPLIDAAIDLLQVDDAEFERRCLLMTDDRGRSLLEDLSAQLDRLGSHVGDVVEALAMTAMRIRSTMAGRNGWPA